jgi:hypothetical protein
MGRCPGAADLRVAVRRTTRVGPNAGNVLEDLGVTPDVVYRISLRDVMGHNQDLIDTALELLAGRKPHSLATARIETNTGRAPSLPANPQHQSGGCDCRRPTPAHQRRASQPRRPRPRRGAERRRRPAGGRRLLMTKP